MIYLTTNCCQTCDREISDGHKYCGECFAGIAEMQYDAHVDDQLFDDVRPDHYKNSETPRR